MDFDFLRQEGIRHLERMAGRRWTDFNTHDPGITILEQLCYALSDLSYRIAYEIPDLLAEGGGDPYEGLYPPHEILTCHAVTPNDLRKLALDVEGVRNAWIEPVTESELSLSYDPERRQLRPETAPPGPQPVKLSGLHRVLIELSGEVDRSVVVAGVARRLHAHRPLCEDFAEIQVLGPEKVGIQARVEIEPSEDAERIWREIFDRLDEHISPHVTFQSLEQRLDAGLPVDEIFDGPLLTHGFIDTDKLAATERRTALHTSDLVHVIMDVAGVRAVRWIEVGGHPWSLTLDSSRYPKLNYGLSKIRLERAGLEVDLTTAQPWQRAAPAGARGQSTRALTPPAGRDRATGHYTSIQQHFPALYGIAEMGLGSSASPARQARAKQLKAYLLFFDQLLANAFAQLAHVKDLFGFGGQSLATYFTQAVEDTGLGLSQVRAGDRDGQSHEHRLAEITQGLESQNSQDSLDNPGSHERKNRFLSHQLARFAEHLSDYSLVLHGAVSNGDAFSASKLARDKQALLSRYPRVSSARGTAIDDLTPGGVPGGFEERLRLKLGLEAEEEMLIVEHILLRPIAGDASQTVPLLSEAPIADPYSLRLSIVFKIVPGRQENPVFRDFILRTVRDETPAHLVPHVRWLEGEAWSDFQNAWRAWLERWRQHKARKLAVG